MRQIFRRRELVMEHAQLPIIATIGAKPPDWATFPDRGGSPQFGTPTATYRYLAAMSGRYVWSSIGWCHEFSSQMIPQLSDCW